jgi:hypothetical protein
MRREARHVRVGLREGRFVTRAAVGPAALHTQWAAAPAAATAPAQMCADSWADTEASAAWQRAQPRRSAVKKAKKGAAPPKPPGVYNLPDGSSYVLGDDARRRPMWGSPFWHPTLGRVVATTEAHDFVDTERAPLPAAPG